MKIRLSAITDIDVEKHLKAVQSDRIGTFAASEWHRLYEPYVPYDTGVLAQQVVITPWQIEHTAPYAAHQYYGTKHRFNKLYHPKASAKWDRAAAATQKPKLIKTLQGYENSGKLDL